MSVLSKLMESAASDIDVLRSLDSNGDDFSKSRSVDFLFRCPDKEKADVLSGFINTYQFGHASPNDESGENTVLVTISMPVEQPIILSVSGFMTCLAELYGVEFDGWGCVAQSQRA